MKTTQEDRESYRTSTAKSLGIANQSFTIALLDDFDEVLRRLKQYEQELATLCEQQEHLHLHIQDMVQALKARNVCDDAITLTAIGNILAEVMDDFKLKS